MELSWLGANARRNWNMREHMPVGEKLKNLLASTLLAASGNNETENMVETCSVMKCVCMQLVLLTLQ